MSSTNVTRIFKSRENKLIEYSALSSFNNAFQRFRVMTSKFSDMKNIRT